MRRVAVIAALVLCPALAEAQAPDGRLEVAGGVRWAGARDYGAFPSEQIRSGGETRVVFRSASGLDPSVGVEGRVGVRMHRRLQIEGAFVFTPSTLTTEISNDIEGVADGAIATGLTEYLAEGGLRVDLRPRRAGRIVPMVLAGGGYMRQVASGNVLVETGRSFYLGAGADVVWRQRSTGALKGTGLRLDVRARGMQGGIAPDDDLRFHAALGASLYVRF